MSNHSQQDLEEARQALDIALKERVFQEVRVHTCGSLS